MKRIAVLLPVSLALPVLFALAMAPAAEPKPPADRSPLPGTAPLTIEGDIAAELVDGVDRFLLRKIDEVAAQRASFWKRDLSSAEAYRKSIEPNRQRLAHILGVRDARAPFEGLEIVATTQQPPLVGRGHGYQVFAVRWPAFGDVTGEGLLLVPAVNTPHGMVPDTRRRFADVVAIPDADQTPEQIAGLAEGVPAESQFARRLAESGCRVLVPMLVSRELKTRGVDGRGWAMVSNREFLYRSAFEMGRHLIGYEVQKVLAAVDWFAKDAGQQKPRIGVIGYGEGGLLALSAAALDTRIDAVCVSGYFDDRRSVWQEPIERNVFGLLEQFGDAELAAMVAPRTVIVEAAKGPELELPSKGGAPARLVTPRLDAVQKEVARANHLVEGLKPAARIELVASGDGTGPFGTAAALDALVKSLAPGAKLAEQGPAPMWAIVRDASAPGARLARQMHEIDRHTQRLLLEGPYVRREFMKKLDTSSLEKYEKSAAEYRKFFYDEVIGRFDDKVLPPAARSRKSYDTEKWTGYEVVMDLWPDVIAYGILLVPKDLKDGQRRPVVVCQHGLEGRPQDIVTGDHPAYHDFAAKLAERGFVTFAPQNLYLGKDRFRTLQRKANPIKKTLFSVITPQHQQIVDWLKTLPFVDPGRIGFYGLSYGGKTAMRVPALVTDYQLSICSADFNDWVLKNASTRSPYSYVWTGEYEIFEFDLGSTFNYAEMAALIAPRAFMVERGHFDGVGSDECVSYEYAKVRHLYAALLKIPERTEIEYFAGPHTINGQGTYRFLHKHLDWPER
jgi:dienelactone hydrolase